MHMHVIMKTDLQFLIHTLQAFDRRIECADFLCLELELLLELVDLALVCLALRRVLRF
jgi:hypothetical protein